MDAWAYADDMDDQSSWGVQRQRLHGFFKSSMYDWILSVLLTCNLVVVIVEVDADARGEQPSTLVQAISGSYTIIYAAEMLGRVFVFRSAVFSKVASLVEFGIVFGDCLVTVLGHTSAISILRIFRLARLARALRLMTLFPELYLMMKGLLGAVSAVMWGCVFLSLCLLVWSIIFVVAVHPYNKELDFDGCSRCPEAFASVGAALLTFSQTIVAGDSWGTIGLPLVETHPWTAPLLAGVFISVSLTVMNLILAVICDGADAARRRGEREFAEAKRKEVDAMKAELSALCTKIDQDGDGILSLDEFMEEYDKEGELYKLLMLSDIERDDLPKLFGVMDRDRSGTVDHLEFVEQMAEVKSQVPDTMLFFIKHYVAESYLKLAEMQKSTQASLQTLAKSQTPGALEPLPESKFGAANSAKSQELMAEHFEDISTLMQSLMHRVAENSEQLEKISRGRLFDSQKVARDALVGAQGDAPPPNNAKAQTSRPLPRSL